MTKLRCLSMVANVSLGLLSEPHTYTHRHTVLLTLLTMKELLMRSYPCHHYAIDITVDMMLFICHHLHFIFITSYIVTSDTMCNIFAPVCLCLLYINREMFTLSLCSVSTCCCLCLPVVVLCALTFMLHIIC